MSLLLDTQAWLWMVTAPDRLSDEARTALEDPQVAIHLSAAAVWEIGIKLTIGKLRITGDPLRQIPTWIARSGVQPLDITATHALVAAQLPMHHRDPFDRMMVAQAQVENLRILTADRRLAAYEVEILEA